MYNPIDGTPMTYYEIKDAATQTRQNNNALNVSYVEPLRKQINQTYSLEFRMRPYAGAQVFGGFTAQRFEGVNCGSSIAGYVVDPNTLRFCDNQNLAAVDDHGVFDSLRNPGVFVEVPGAPVADQGGRTPLAKDFRLGVSLPLPWYGVNLGVNYLNNDEGSFSVLDPLTLTSTLSNLTFNPATCGNGTTRYPDGLTGCTNASGGSAVGSDAIVYGSSNTRKIATATSPACPTAYGCVPGSPVTPITRTFLAGATATTASRQLFPDGRIRRERLNQLDLKVSKTFRVSNFSILPTVEAANVFNQAKINAISSATYATTGGTYGIPSSVLQSRIIGVGAQIRW